MPTLTQYLVDTFNRGSTTVAGAGTTTGVGNGWIDRVGNIWSLNANVLNSAAPNGAFCFDWLTRPTSENSLNQEAVWYFAAGAGIPIPLLRVDSANDNAYGFFYDGSHLNVNKFIGGNASGIGTPTAFSALNAATTPYILKATALPNATTGTDLTLQIFAASDTGLTTPLATTTVTGDTTSGLQTALGYGVANTNGFAGATKAILYNGSSSGSPTLTLAESGATVVDGAGTITLTPTLTNSANTLTASVTGGGTISGTIASGVGFTYTPPSTGSGTATITVTSSADGISASQNVAYSSGVAAAVSISPTNFPEGVATPFTMTGTGTSWNSSTVPHITAGGSGAYMSNFTQSGQTLTGTLYGGTSLATLTIGTSQYNSSTGAFGASLDGATTTAQVTAATNLGTLIWHGTSLTHGQNGTGDGTTSATRLLQTIEAMGPGYTPYNFGVDGQTLTQLLSTFMTSVVPVLVGGGKPNYLFVEGGHNDYGSGGGYKTSAQVITLIQQYLTQAMTYAQANGILLYIIWSTESPAAYPGVYPANFDTLRNVSNAWLEAYWQTYGIWALCRDGADLQTGYDGAEYNPTYYNANDHTHRTDVGYARWGQNEAATIMNRLKTTLSGTTTTVTNTVTVTAQSGLPTPILEQRSYIFT